MTGAEVPAPDAKVARVRPGRRLVAAPDAAALAQAAAPRATRVTDAPIDQRSLLTAWKAGVEIDETSALLADWVRWLTLSATPLYTAGSRPLDILAVVRGEIVDPLMWPREAAPRVYVAYDDTEAVYVGQTSLPLMKRVRRHFGSLATADQREKAGTWDFIASVAFARLHHGQLGQLETSAANWILPAHRHLGRRHPRAM